MSLRGLVKNWFNFKRFNDNDFHLFLKNEKFNKFMGRVENISTKSNGISFFSIKNIKDEQVGYRLNAYGKSLIGTEKGDWKKSWVVIGFENLLGDPIFVDFNKPELPVFTSIQDADKWTEKYIAISLDNFQIILKDLKEISNLKSSIISKVESDELLEKIKIDNKWMDVEFWRDFLESEE